MRTNQVKRAIGQGDRAVGTFLFEFNTTGIGRLAASAGAEFIVFDMEHTGWSIETIRMLVATTRSTAAVPLVRVPATDYHFVARVLDMGVMGVMSPMVESAEQARRLVQAAKYPPQGRRGAAFGVAHDDYLGGSVQEKMESANRETLLIAQIETERGLEHVEEIAAVDGVDVLWIGQFDLTSFLGIPGQFDHPQFHAALERVLAACRQHGKTAGYMVTDVASGKAMVARGFRMICYSGDLWIYQEALRQGIAALK